MIAAEQRMESPEAVLEAREVTKQYPGTLALDRVNFRLRRGEVHALIGENGAGKSTLVKILAGIEQPTGGTLVLDGAEIRLGSVRDADARGIGIIHQELNLCPNLTVAENILLARELIGGFGVVDRRREAERAGALLARLGQRIDPGARVGDLPLGQQQIVEVAKSLHRDVRVLMMDEPTSALSGAEIMALFRIIRELASKGVAIAYISHRLEELLEIADFVSVLRDGRMVAEAPVKEIDIRWIVERMTGRSSSAVEARAHKVGGSEALRVEGLSFSAEGGRSVVREVSFQVRADEVVGVYGLMGAGRTELLECLMGLHPGARGRVWLDSVDLSGRDTSQRIAAGLAMVPEDRQVSGLVPSLPVRANITLASLGEFVRGFWISNGRESEAASAMAAELGIRTPGIEREIGTLSGGNQQKVVIAKCLLTSPRVLLLDEPTRGVDVAAKREIYGIVERLAGHGIGIVFVSSELEEIRLVADRILVMSRGRIAAEFDAASASDDALASAASFDPDRLAGESDGNHTS